MDVIWQWFSWLNDAYDINLTIFYDDVDRGRFLTGIVTTLKLSAVCIVASIVIGIVGAWLQMSRFVVVRSAVDAYIQFFRNTPPLIQMYFFYFAVDAALVDSFRLSGSLLGSFGWAALSLSFFAGAFNVEIFRSGIEAVPKSTVEAADSLGYTKRQIYQYVTLPLALRVCLPALGSNLINLVKTTTAAYAIAVPETLYMANQIWSDEFNVPEMMNVVWLVYLALVGILVWAMHRLEAAIRIPGYGQG
ncbi:amino acid ABC transporter permease [Shinella zoogloeoides]|uniref:amino acid ABC transporter permease n=1 Tax=Shinella zoogloeoides TaxID=352475 RepID=UPI001F55EBCC|nr:amino acid ABC transporter permease [Shinella zoogloeoides]